PRAAHVATRAEKIRSGCGGQSGAGVSGPIAAKQTPDRYSISNVSIIAVRPFLITACAGKCQLLALADNLHELVLWREENGLGGESETGLLRGAESLLVKGAGGCAIEHDLFCCAVRMHEFQRRASITDEIAARAQGIAPRILLSQRDEPQRGEQTAACRVLCAVAETQPAQRREAQDEAVL